MALELTPIGEPKLLLAPASAALFGARVHAVEPIAGGEHEHRHVHFPDAYHRHRH